MRQRAVVAMALVNEPRLLTADEPTSGLDVIRAAELVRLLDDLREELGLALLVVSHDLPFVLRLVDRLVVLRDGRVVEQGDARRVATHPTSAAARRLVEGTLHGPGSPASGAAVQSPPGGLGSVGRTP